VVAHDGSWAEATGGGLVTFDGTHDPWETVETAHQTWTQLGQPQPSALGLTITPDKQYVWCQHPDSDWTHPLTSQSSGETGYGDQGGAHIRRQGKGPVFDRR
jgi:hypothetical protein